MGTTRIKEPGKQWIRRERYMAVPLMPGGAAQPGVWLSRDTRAEAEEAGAQEYPPDSFAVVKLDELQELAITMEIGETDHDRETLINMLHATEVELGEAQRDRNVVTEQRERRAGERDAAIGERDAMCGQRDEADRTRLETAACLRDVIGERDDCKESLGDATDALALVRAEAGLTPNDGISLHDRVREIRLQRDELQYQVKMWNDSLEGQRAKLLKECGGEIERLTKELDHRSEQLDAQFRITMKRREERDTACRRLTNSLSANERLQATLDDARKGQEHECVRADVAEAKIAEMEDEVRLFEAPEGPEAPIVKGALDAQEKAERKLFRFKAATVKLLRAEAERAIPQQTTSWRLSRIADTIERDEHMVGEEPQRVVPLRKSYDDRMREFQIRVAQQAKGAERNDLQMWIKLGGGLGMGPGEMAEAVVSGAHVGAAKKGGE